MKTIEKTDPNWANFLVARPSQKKTARNRPHKTLSLMVEIVMINRRYYKTMARVKETRTLEVVFVHVVTLRVSSQ